jgi:CPA2 family monovalent cation:H+ antiporter-2
MDFALAILICALLGITVKKLSLPAIPAYIMAGILLGKSGAGLFGESEVSKALAELGIIFLLFYIGLELKLSQISARKGEITYAGLIDLLVNFPVGFAVASLLGFDFREAFVMASALYISSSAVVIQSLIENRKLIFSESETIIWLMVFEDIMLVLLIVGITAQPSEILLFLAKLIIFSGFILVAGRIALKYVESVFRREDELPYILAFSIAASAIYLSKFLEIPEAFLAIVLGIMFSEVHGIGKLIRPFKEVFIVLFFFFFAVSVDVTANISLFVLVSIILVAIASKLISGLAIGRLIHGSTSSGIEIGASTVARGEFSILLTSIYGAPTLSAIIAVFVVVTSLVGSFTAKYSRAISRLVTIR